MLVHFVIVTWISYSLLSIVSCYHLSIGKISYRRFQLGRFLSTCHMPTVTAQSIDSRSATTRIYGGYTSIEHRIEKSLSDDRVYHQFVLPNSIPVTVVHDRKSEKSSCSLGVRVGAAMDPLPGIAHITEHAVFLGSQKYPVENEYKNFLNQNGGSSNAGTGMEQTTYKFNVNAKAFDHALDIFSQFFKGPLFNSEAMCREVMAVDAEDSKNRIIDSRRVLQVLKHQIHPSNNYAKFSTGNLKTLAFGDIDVFGAHLTDSIRSFHKQHYRPENMAVVLVGPQSIAELQRMAEAHFSSISSAISQHSSDASDQPITAADASSNVTPSNTNVTGGKSRGSSSIFISGGGKLIRMKPIRDIRDVQVMWQLPDTSALYRSNPCSLIGYIVGNKGVGSVFAALQDRGWATSTSAGMRTTFEGFTLFEASASLTEAGLEHWREVVSLLYQAIETVGKSSDDELRRIWSELRTINIVDFQYQQKQTAYELAPYLASHMLDYPPHHILSAGYVLEDIDLDLVRSYLQELQPSNSMVILRSQSFDDLGSDDPSHLQHLFNRLDEQLLSEGALSPEQLHHLKQTGKYFHHLGKYDSRTTTGQATGGGTAENTFLVVEPFYGVPYSISDLPQEQLPIDLLSHGSIDLPPRNDYICAELITAASISSAADTTNDLTSPREEPSSLVHELPLRSTPPTRLLMGKAEAEAELSSSSSSSSFPARREVWLSSDEVFHQPRTVLFSLMPSSSCADSHPVLSLVTQVFSQVTARKYYQSAEAGLDFSFGLGPRGVSLTFYGYSTKLPQLAADVSRDIGSRDFWDAIDPEIILNCKERLVRSLKSWDKERPDSQCDALLRVLLQEGSWLPQRRLEACEEIDLDSFRARVSSALQTMTGMLSYAHGSADRSTAVKTFNAIGENLFASQQMNSGEESASASLPVCPDVKSEWGYLRDRARLLPRASTGSDGPPHHVVALPTFNMEDPNSALVRYIQVDAASPLTSALLLFMRRALGEPAFTELRTKKQLGYVVSLSTGGYGRGLKSVRGLSVTILSKRFSPVVMEKELDDFLATQQGVLSQLTNEEVSDRCSSIIKSLQDPPTTYTEEAREFWDAIVTESGFDWTQRVVDELTTLTRDDVLAAADRWIFNRKHRRSVSMMIFGATQIEELEQMKQASSSSSVADISRSDQHYFSVEDMLSFRDSLDLHEG